MDQLRLFNNIIISRGYIERGIQMLARILLPNLGMKWGDVWVISGLSCFSVLTNVVFIHF